MATINKKVWREYFEKIISGKKKLKLRLADFEVRFIFASPRTPRVRHHLFWK